MVLSSHGSDGSDGSAITQSSDGSDGSEPGSAMVPIDSFDQAFIASHDVEKLFGYNETQEAPFMIHKHSSDLNHMFGLSDDEDKDTNNKATATSSVTLNTDKDKDKDTDMTRTCHAGKPITELSDFLSDTESFESEDSNKTLRLPQRLPQLVTPCKKRRLESRLENDSTSKVKPHAPPLLPARLPGIEHWQEPLVASMASRRRQLPEKPWCPMSYELYCAGMASEVPIFQAYIMLLLM